MQEPTSHDLRDEILRVALTLTDLEDHPEFMSRVRTFLGHQHPTIETALRTLVAALDEGGVASTLRQVRLDDVNTHTASTLITVDRSGRFLTIDRTTKFGVDGRFIGSEDPVGVPLYELSTLGGFLQVVDIVGRFHSFLSVDSTLPPIRGHSRIEEPPPHRLRDVWPYMRRVLRAEKSDILVVTGYSVLSSLLGLVVPVASQAIVNAVALGVFSQQLVVLCLLVLAAMIALAVVAVLERSIIDVIQRRLFVRTSFDIVYRLPLIKRSALRQTYGPELVNRFFDVITVQKSLGKFLLEGINSILVLLTGLILLGLYHPFFLLYDLAFLVFLPLLVLVIGRGAIPTAIKVSKRKYETAAWLEDVARAQIAWKITGASHHAMDQVDTIATRYVDARKKHFTVLARQIFGSYVFKAFATVGILGLGGALVIEQQISLGQLVAAEIVILMIIGALDKLIAQFDVYYDLVAAMDKLSAIAEQPMEDVGGLDVPRQRGGGSLEFKNVALAFDGAGVLRDITLDIPSGSRVGIVGPSGAGKSTILELAAGLFEADRGRVAINGVDVRTSDLASLRSRIGYVFPDNQLIPGTVLDNILLGRKFPVSDIDWALSMVRLDRDISKLEYGLQTMVTPTGETLPFGIQRRMVIARMLIGKPDILLLDEAFDGIEDAVKLDIIDKIFKYRFWTVVCVTHDPEIVRRCPTIVVVDDGKVVQTGDPRSLCELRDGTFHSLFPQAQRYFSGEDDHG